MPKWIRIQTPKFLFGSDPKGVKIKEDNFYQKMFDKICLNDIKTPLKISTQSITKGLKKSQKSQKDYLLCLKLWSITVPIRFIFFFSHNFRLNTKCLRILSCDVKCNNCECQFLLPL